MAMIPQHNLLPQVLYQNSIGSYSLDGTLVMEEMSGILIPMETL